MNHPHSQPHHLDHHHQSNQKQSQYPNRPANQPSRRISFLSYLLTPKPHTDYKDVTHRVLHNEKLEQAIQESARDQLHSKQTKPSCGKGHAKRPIQNGGSTCSTRRVSMVERDAKSEQFDSISSQAIAGEIANRLSDMSTSSSSDYASISESGFNSEANSPSNCSHEPFRFGSGRQRSFDAECNSHHIDTDDGGGSRSLRLNSIDSIENAFGLNGDPARPRTTAALANYEQQFAQFVSDQKQRATDLLNQMRTCISSMLLRIAGWILIKVLCRLFNSVLYRPSEMQMLKHSVRQQSAPLVFLPVHRSHLDYVLISFVLYMKGVAPPLVAAGDNLNIPLFGTLMRGLGAFFIRRRMDPIPGVRDVVYRSLLQAYVTENLKVHQNLEFFIEGARSRTGKLLLPKVGLLSVIVDGVLNNQVADVQLVPVGVSYEKLVDGGFMSEQLGANKEPESFWLAAKSIWRRLTSGHFGDVRVTFGQPFSLRQFVTQQEHRLSGGSSLLASHGTTLKSPDLLNRTSSESPPSFSVPNPADNPNRVCSLFSDLSEMSARSIITRKSSESADALGRRSIWTHDTFGRHRSDQCVACQAFKSNVSLSPPYLPMLTLTNDRRRQLIQRLADHVAYSAFSNCAVLDTHALSALLLYKHRKGCTLKQLMHSLENLRDLVKQRGREYVQTNHSSLAVSCALQLLGRECVHWMRARLESIDLITKDSGVDRSTLIHGSSLAGVQQHESDCTDDDQPLLFVVRPNVRSPAVLQLHYYASNCTATFSLDSVLATVLIGTANALQSSSEATDSSTSSSICCLERISVDSGLGVDSQPEPPRLLRSECIARAERLCDLLRFEFVFVPPCVRLRDALENVFDQYLAAGWIHAVPLSSFERAQMGRRRRRTADRIVSFAEYEDESSSACSWPPTPPASLSSVSPLSFVPSTNPTQTQSNLPNRRYQIDPSHQDDVRFMQSMLIPILEGYSVLVSCLHLLLNNPLEERTFLKLVLEYGRQCLDNDILQFEESLATELFRNALKLLEHEKVLCFEERVGARRLRLTGRYRSEANLRTLSTQFQQFRV